MVTLRCCGQRTWRRPMERHGWRIGYAAMGTADRAIPRRGRRTRYSDVRMAAWFLWAVAHDRPMCRACQGSSYRWWFRPRRLPSASPRWRRIRHERCQKILQVVLHPLADSGQPTTACFLDARPLTIGPCSKDRPVKAGRVYGGFARGYKLHAIVSSDGQIGRASCRERV